MASHRATVHELRADDNDRSQKQADLVVQGIGGTITETLVDVGVTHPSSGTMNSYQPWKSRAAAANTYARTKDNKYRGLLAAAQHPYDYSSFVVETYGAWGASARNLRDSVCDPALHPLFEVDSNPWCNPDPKRTFTLAIAFAIQRGNAHMIQRAAFRRARNRRRGLYSSRLRA